MSFLETRQLALLDAVGALVLVLDGAGRLERLNRACRRFIGVEEEAGRFAWEVLRAEAPEASFEALLAAGVFPAETEGCWTLPDGRRLCASWTLEALLDASGVVEHVVCTGTEREEAGVELRRLNRFYERVLDDLPTAFGVLDPEGRYRYLNRAAYADPELRSWLIGKTPVDYCLHRGVDPGIGHRRMDYLRRAVEEKRTIQFEESFNTHTRGLRHFIRLMSPIVSPEGVVRQVAAYGVDITERRESELALERAKEHAEEMLRLKGSLLTNITHELRTPLAGILGCAQVLRDEVPDDQREFVQMIASAGDRLLATLNGVLDLAQLESGSMLLRPEAVDAAAVVRETAERFRAAAEAKGLDLDVEARGEAGVRLDRAGLARLLSNLIDNAVKFTETGGVLVRLEAGQERIRVEVADTGVGIGEEFRPRLFEPFQQESDGLARSFEGNGLGLAVVSRLVRLMGGSVTVESRRGTGSSFVVELPAGGE